MYAIYLSVFICIGTDEVQDEADPEIEFKSKTDDDDDDDQLGGVIKRRGPNPDSYQLHFDEIENRDNGNETILAQAPAALDSYMGPDINLNTDLRNTSGSGARKETPDSESTFYNANFPPNGNRDETIDPAENQSEKRPVKESRGVKFNMDINETVDADNEGDTIGLFGASDIQGEDDFTMSTSKFLVNFFLEFQSYAYTKEEAFRLVQTVPRHRYIDI